MTDDLRLHIYRDIEPGEIFRYGRSVVVHGNVGKGAHIEIKNGGLEIEGNVGDGVRVRAQSKSESKTGIRIHGATGNDVTLDSNRPVSINGAGDGLRIRSASAISLGHAGDSLNVTGLSTVTGGNVGRNASIRAAGSCHLGQIGHGSTVTCDGVIQFTSAGHDCRFITSESVYAAAVGAGTIVEAQDHAQIGLAHVFHSVTAHSVDIGTQSGAAAPFELLDDKKWRAALSASHFRPPQS